MAACTTPVGMFRRLHRKATIPSVSWVSTKPETRADSRAPRLRSSSAAALITLALAGSAAPAATLPPLPAKWPRTLQIGVSDDPGGAAALRRVARFGFRYQYLAGGVNTGTGWST